MIGLTISPSPESAARLERLGRQYPRKISGAVARAINRAGRNAVTQAKRIISRELGVKQSDLVNPHRFGAKGGQSTGRAIRWVPATPDNLNGSMWFSGRRIPLIYFRAKATPLTEQAPVRVFWQGQLRTFRRRGSGVRWKIGMRTNFAKDAFIGRGRRGNAASADVSASGHLGVFARNPGARRLKIHELKGPSIPYAAKKNKAVHDAMRAQVTEMFNTRLAHELTRIEGIK